MGVLLALGAALLYGVGDFNGGLAARRSSVLRALLLVNPVALVVVTTLSVLVFTGVPTTRDLLLAAIAGLLGGLGLLAFFTALAIGPMGVVAPVTALSNALVPILVGLAIGERPAPVALVGMVLALLAITLVSRPPESHTDVHGVIPVRAVLLALLSGVAFGLFYSLMHGVDSAAGSWPLVVSRMTNIAVVITAAVLTGSLALPERAARAPAVLSGAADGLANVLLLLALQSGLLSVVAVVVSLYPATTVLLARVQLGERMHRVQTAGLVAAGAAAVMLALAH